MTTSRTTANTLGRGILIVEDDKDLLQSMVDYLTLKGYNVTGVGSAREFYKSISEQVYAVVILDIGLPDQDGILIAQYIRKNTDMRIIIASARASTNDKIIGREAGADIYLVKPVHFQELVTTIDSLLSRLGEINQPPKPTLAQLQVAPSNTQSWKLITKKWLLVSPQGDAVQLTAKELDFITILVSHPHAVGLRLDLLKSLGYLNNESGNHSLESLIKRLRYKFTLHHIEFPLQTAHGIGYSFLADIIVE